jgi:Zn-dependent protease with chaperone function
MVPIPTASPEVLTFRHIGVALRTGGLLLALVFPWALLATGAWRRISTTAERLCGGRLLLAAALCGAAYGLLWSVASDLVELGLRANREAFSGFPPQSWTDWTRERAVATTHLTGAGLVLAPLGYALIRGRPRTWPLWAAAVCSAFAYVWIAVSPLTADTEPLPPGPLRTSIQHVLLAGGHADAPLVLLRNSSPCVSGSNMGVFPTTRIVLDDGYLAYPVRQGAETAAHELGHFVRHDAELGVAAGAVWILAIFLAMQLGGRVLVRGAGARYGVSRVEDPASLPVLLFCALIAYEAGLPVFNSVQRQAERRADGFAMWLTHDGEAGAVQMVRDARCDRLDPGPGPFTRTVFWNHPTIAERIRYMNRYAPPAPEASRASPTASPVAGVLYAP